MRKFDIGEYKYKLVQDILASEKIVKAIDSHSKKYDPENPETLLMENVFPHVHIPKIQTSEETYVMLSCDVTNINKNNSLFHNIKLTIRVMAHQEKLKMQGEKNTRIDYISNELINIFEDSLKYGFGCLRLSSDREVILNERYIYRELIFTTLEIAANCG